MSASDEQKLDSVTVIGNTEFDGDVEIGESFHDEYNQVTSSPENCDGDGDFLPFQSLSVELEEGEDPACTTTCNADSSEDTVFSTNGPSDQVYTGNDGSLTDNIAEQSTGDTELIEDDVEICEMTPEVDDDAAVDFDANDFLQQQDNAKAYLEDFLLSAPSSSVKVSVDSDSASNDEKGLALHRFPKILKAMGLADYSTLQVLYRLMYLKNAWDTEKMLAQRILEFTGFNCEVNSNDYYMREVILRTASCDIVRNISNLLGIYHSGIGKDSEKYKIELVGKIMSFLQKPKRPTRKRRSTFKRNGSSLARGPQRFKKASSPSSAVQKRVPSEEELMEMEKDLKQKVREGKAAQLKVDVVKLTINSTDDVIKVSDVCKDRNNASDSEETSDTVLSFEKKKLRDFPSVLSSIEGTPEDLLGDLHMLLFSRRGRPCEIKDRILDFEGFSFEVNPEAYKSRVKCLNEMNEDVVKDITRALFLDPKSDKGATIIHLLSFLNKPKEDLLRPTVIAPGMLSDCEFDIEDMSDFESDDSITCEVVHKKVECIDLLSSEDEADVKDADVEIKVEPEDKPPKMSTEPVTASTLSKRTLRDFETITKIVNTHPTEYLVDIYNLLYLKNYEVSTIRHDILDFSSFEFDRKSTEYTKRKQFLDRMLYNSVRRIYNTLIHNTREVKVFSKPTMIGEIFQFLFKLPDTDTSVRLLPPKPSVPLVSILNKIPTVNAVLPQVLIPNVQQLSQTGKLSDLKRVFQRVACFPCEYLIDVHKLLFMTDCDMKDIRTNIFGFKGFSFAENSPEFNQRKLYLEYLTFHSLRKISSVLTTKTVDLRNSTKHELASHLTELLKEYTNTNFETPPMEPSISSVAKAAEPIDPGVEQIVVTPIISTSSPCVTPERCNSPAENNNTVTSSTSVTTKLPSSIPGPKSSKATSIVKPQPVKEIALPVSDANASMQFFDPHRSEAEKFNSAFPSKPSSVVVSSPTDKVSAIGYRPEFVLQQVPIVTPYLQTYAAPIRIQAAPFVLPPSTMKPNILKDDNTVKSTHEPRDEVEVMPSSKRMKTMSKSVESSTSEKKDDNVNTSSLHLKIRDAMTKASEDEEDCDKPLATLLGHPNDKVLKQQICDIVENTNLQEITINGVIQKIFNMYPQFNLNYRKDFIKSTLRSLLYQLGEQSSSKVASCVSVPSDSPDCSVSTTDDRDSPVLSRKLEAKRKR